MTRSSGRGQGSTPASRSGPGVVGSRSTTFDARAPARRISPLGGGGGDGSGFGDVGGGLYGTVDPQACIALTQLYVTPAPVTTCAATTALTLAVGAGLDAAEGGEAERETAHAKTSALTPTEFTPLVMANGEQALPALAGL